MNATKTQIVIEQLVADLGSPSESKSWGTVYFFGWVSCFSFLALAAYLGASFFPENIHLPHEPITWHFWIDGMFWFLLSVISGRIASLQAQLGKSTGWKRHLFGVLAVGLLFSIFLQNSEESRFIAFQNELNWVQGPCGLYILATGFLLSLMMFWIIRKAAPLAANSTAAWSATSVGCMSTFLMHLVCTHNNAAHVIIWHTTPLILLTCGAWTGGKKFLSW